MFSNSEARLFLTIFLKNETLVKPKSIVFYNTNPFLACFHDLKDNLNTISF